MNRAFLWSALFLVGCYDPGPYGYDRLYVPSNAEQAYVESARQPAYNEVRSDPVRFENQVIAWFGVVTDVTPPARGSDVTVVKLSHRIHQERHLCTDMERETCRVTVSDRSEGPFTIRIRMRPEDVRGRNRMQQGSMVRVYGTVTGDYDADGGPILETRLYRHWPRGQYVTAQARRDMRR